MTTLYPGAIDDFTNPTPTSKTTNPSHSAQHANANDAIESIETYVGTSAGTPAGSLTDRINALEAGGGDATSVDGWSVEVVSSLPAVQDPNTIYFVEGASNNYVTIDTEQTITGIKHFNQAVLIEHATNPLIYGKLETKADPNSSTGNVMTVDSIEGVQVSGPYVVLDTDNFQTTMPGANAGDQLVVAAVDSFGVVSFGYAASPPPAYSVSDTHNIDVVLKAANVAPNPAVWVDLGLSVTITEDIQANAGNMLFDMILSNPTVRTGVVEYGVEVGGVMSPNTLLFQIPADYLQTTATVVAIQQAITAGTVATLKARVISNSNNQFSLTVDNTPVVSQFKIWSVGAVSGGGGATNLGYIASPTNGTVTSDTGADAIIPLVDATNAGLLSPTNFTTFNNKVDNVTATAPVAVFESPAGTINVSMPAATNSVSGYLSSSNWSTFNNKAPTASPTFTGVPAAPTAAVGTDTTQLATTAFVNAEIANDAPTKSGGGATGTWGIGITGTAAVATRVDNVNSASNLMLWTGTEAEYTAIGSKDPNTLYFRTA